MKKTILSFAMMLFVSMSVLGQDLAFNEPSSKESKAEKESFMIWEKSAHEFGTIEKGMPVKAVFEFTNSGSSAISISQVKTTCGCTVTNYSKNSLPPGEKGYVKATYNAAREGAFHKKLIVITSQGEQINLSLKGMVK